MVNNIFSLLLGLLLTVIFIDPAFAQDFNEVAENITESGASFPGLIAALAYISGMVIGVSAIFKTIDHVNNPAQTPLGTPVIRFLVGGALFSLPIIAETVRVTIGGDGITVFDPSGEAATFINSIFGVLSSAVFLGTSLNTIMANVINSVELMPALIAAVSYILGLVIAVSALYKTRDHVEDPSRVPLKDAVIRYITAGALFSLPVIYTAMYDSCLLYTSDAADE